MKIKSLATEKPDYLRFGLGVLVFSVCFLLALPELSRFWEPAGMFVVTLQVLPAAFWLRFRANIPISKTVLITSIPAGILATVLGFHAITVNSGSSEGRGSGAALMTLTILYGGLLAIVAYATRNKHDYKIPVLDPFTVLPCALPLTYSYLVALSTIPGITFFDYVSPKVVFLFCGIFILLLAGSALSNVARILAETAITGIILSIVIALVVWFPGIAEGTIPKDATDIATLGLLYGTFLFMMSYYVSLVTGETDEINFDIKNWHLVESAALYILLVFAPPSIFEISA